MTKSDTLTRSLTEVDANFQARPGILAGQLATDVEFPVFAEHSKGSYVFDIEGNRYLDFILGFGSVILGHSNESVDNAVIRAIRRGINPTLHTTDQIQLTKLLCSSIPNADMVAILRTGSDATTAAVRIARAHTGRQHIIRWGYNGWHDWCAPRETGIPQATRKLTSTFEYGNLSSLEAVFLEHRHEIAAVIMMPLEVDVPSASYLADIASLTRKNGALLIFDEIRTGFRLALGGAQEFFGVQADLATFSKAMANGYCISCVTGPKHIMQCIENISMSSLFFRSRDGIAASIATIESLRDGNSLTKIWSLGNKFMTGLSAAAQATGVPARAAGLPPMPYIEFDLKDNSAAKQVFADAMIRRGILIHPNHHWFICEEMGGNDIDIAVQNAKLAFEDVKHFL
ncbi:MAG TPA: aspartate aminotransferase family protein, partial [Gammaproteobacteria bacterium]|nr:aspartate aminotransferase family protein [Gammaproteobacteria bacterium]